MYSIKIDQIKFMSLDSLMHESNMAEQENQSETKGFLPIIHS